MKTGGVGSSVFECLPSRHEALGWILRTKEMKQNETETIPLPPKKELSEI
jgi:hypothetical protein